MRILVTGGTGQVGTELGKHLPSRYEIDRHGHKELPIDSEAAVRAAIAGGGYGLVINAAAYTAVDKAESEPDRAQAVNADGPGFLAKACAAANIPLIHISTDYVYDGTKTMPYTEDDPVNPLGVYGATKWAGEQNVAKFLDQHLILRTSWVYAAHGHNFLHTMLRLGRERPELRIVADQRGAPTSAAALADAIVVLAERVAKGAPINWGTYHACNAGETTWYGFAQEIFRIRAQLSGTPQPRLTPIGTRDYPTPAKRPANSRLSCEKLWKNFGVSLPDWKESLRSVMWELNQMDEA